MLGCPSSVAGVARCHHDQESIRYCLWCGFKQKVMSIPNIFGCPGGSPAMCVCQCALVQIASGCGYALAVNSNKRLTKELNYLGESSRLRRTNDAYNLTQLNNYSTLLICCKCHSNRHCNALPRWFGLSMQIGMGNRDYCMGLIVFSQKVPYYCVFGADKAFVQEIVDAHCKACLYARTVGIPSGS